MEFNNKYDCLYLIDSIDMWANTIEKIAKEDKESVKTAQQVCIAYDFIIEDSEIIQKLANKLREIIKGEVIYVKKI